MHADRPETGRAAAEAAFTRGDWQAAYDGLRAACDADADDPGVLDRLGQAAWWLGHLDEAAELRKQAYAAYARHGRRRAAARVALWLAVEDAGGPAVAGGWLARAERLLREEPDGPEHGWLEVRRAKWASDPADAERHAARALGLAHAAGDPDLEVSALCQLGLAHIGQGRVGEGMRALDEAMAAAMAGEATDPWAVGDTCCQMLVACNRLSDLDRAVEWCRRVIDFTERRRFTPLAGLCRSLYAGVLMTLGDWERAEAELLASRRAFARTQREREGLPLAGLAELRIRQGRFDEAERLLEGVQDSPVALPAVVALRLHRGEARAAAELLERRLALLGERDPAGSALLPLLVRAHVADGDLDGAQAAADRLAAFAAQLGQAHVAAHAEAAAADVAAARGDGVAAAAHLERALRAFRRLGMPLDEGRTHLRLARVLADEGSELAATHARAALERFRQLGAAGDLDAASALLRSLGLPGRAPARVEGELTEREREVLALLAEGLSNPEIAERLVISRKTAGHHVSRILMKIGARSRAEAAAYAVRHLDRAS